MVVVHLGDELSERHRATVPQLRLDPCLLRRCELQSRRRERTQHRRRRHRPARPAPVLSREQSQRLLRVRGAQRPGECGDAVRAARNSDGDERGGVLVEGCGDRLVLHKRVQRRHHLRRPRPRRRRRLWLWLRRLFAAGLLASATPRPRRRGAAGATACGRRCALELRGGGRPTARRLTVHGLATFFCRRLQAPAAAGSSAELQRLYHLLLLGSDWILRRCLGGTVRRQRRREPGRLRRRALSEEMEPPAAATQLNCIKTVSRAGNLENFRLQ
eukprot:SAG11_NODE_16_length_26235_cov_39.900417_5_plen_273_part_00